MGNNSLYNSQEGYFLLDKEICYTIGMDSPHQCCLSHLHCPECNTEFNPQIAQTYCENCTSPLFAQYDLQQVKRLLNPTSAGKRPRGMWRWAELLPVVSAQNRLSLGEGDTPLLQLREIGKTLGVKKLYIKDESFNPTGTFKARGLAAAVSKAVELGIDEFVIPTAGNAGGALAAYTSRAGLEAHIFMPEDAPAINQQEVRMLGAELYLVEGLITDAAREAARLTRKHGWFPVSTFKEPYRVEGKKIMGYELAEGFAWQLPDVIIYPTGGGTGLVGMWKAFQEMEELGWIGEKRPRMVSVQASGCAPIVCAFEAGAERISPWTQRAETTAAGLRVPSVFADRLVLRALYDSQGTAEAVSDQAIQQAQRQLAAGEGIFASPEGAATLAALINLLNKHWIHEDDSVVLFNTGSGLKYL
jgi:threonine synthase